MKKLVNTLKRSLKIMIKARPIDDPARRYFEKTLIPKLGASGINNVLFVGVGPYTWHYSKLFKAEGISFITLDLRPEAAIWGSPEGHITCDIQDVSKHAGDMRFDLVILMGVIGYGVNDPETARNMLTAATSLLNSDGRILVACESRFGIDPIETGSRCTPALTPVASYGMQGSVKIPDYDYSFYFLSPDTDGRIKPTAPAG